MAQAGQKAAPEANGAPTNDDLAADIEQLKADIAQLTEQLRLTAEQLRQTGEHSYGAARRAASEGVDQLRAQGEAALDALRANASDLEEQLTDKVREKPLTSLAIAAGVGYLFALLARR
jgi:ElaB/YqjD/DUF883 family membrane-anchored ribosome-binding protein